MLGKKIGLVTIGAVLATFAIGQVGSLIAHRGFAGSTAWAQSWDDPADDTAADSRTPTLPNVSGSYSGSIEDHRFGDGTISATISQGGASGGVLSGSWSTDVGGGASGKLKGKVKPNNAVTLSLKIRGACHLVGHGTFENGDEIVGVYHAAGCGGADHGNFDMTD